MPKDDDSIPDAYPYLWSAKSSTLSIEEFVAKFKPSMVQDDGTKPWLWVRNSNPNSDTGRQEAIEEATELLTNITKKVEKIKNDDSIPTRSNKKTGVKSKKELREQIQMETSQTLRDIHTRHGYQTGKWLIFVPSDRVDIIWSRIATSVATGPLSQTSVTTAKVATTPMNESLAQHLICVYMPDVFDQPRVTEVMRILLRNHGVNLSGVKSDLYTEIGLDSKHPSGIPSTVWKNTTLLKEVEIKELKDLFFADIKVNQEKNGSNQKPKTTEDDPFASDEEHEGEKRSTAKAKPPMDDPFASDEDESNVNFSWQKPTKTQKKC